MKEEYSSFCDGCGQEWEGKATHTHTPAEGNIYSFVCGCGYENRQSDMD